MNDETIRRIREESHIRVEGQGRRRSFAGWCAVATLASGISLAALDAHDAQLQAAQEAAEQEAVRQANADRRKP